MPDDYVYKETGLFKVPSHYLFGTLNQALVLIPWGEWVGQYRIFKISFVTVSVLRILILMY